MISDNQQGTGPLGQRASSVSYAAGQTVSDKLAEEMLQEQRRRRRWSIFFKLLTFAYITYFLVILIKLDSGAFPQHVVSSGAHTALVNLRGEILDGGAVSADKILPALRRAFEAKKSKGVILRINSPGGSPVQAGIIHDEILRLKKAFPKKPVHVVIEDVGASAGYYIAAAADNVYVNKASLVGSIGVVISTFGLAEAMQKVGVERRLLTAGENKVLLDSFLPVDNKQRAYLQLMLDEIHQQFIMAVKEGRQDRLKQEEGQIFSGLVWTGKKSIELGLADGEGTVESVARDVIGAEDIVDYSLQPPWSERIADRLGAVVMTFLRDPSFSIR